MASVPCEEERERDEMRKRSEKGRNEKKRRTGRRSGWPGLVDEGDTLMVEVAGGDGADEVEDYGLRAGEEGARRKQRRPHLR